MSRLRKRAALPLLLVLAGCASYHAQPFDPVEMQSRAQTQERGGLRVTAAVPSADEAKAIFGIPVYDRKVQPVWLEVENRSAQRFRFAPTGTDRDYFSPMEVWYTNQGRFSNQGSKALQARILELTMARQIPAGETRSGFVFTHASAGTKAFNVDLFGNETAESFTFFIDVPGFLPDHGNVDFANLYPPDEVRHVSTSAQREALSELPCCTTQGIGKASELPLNAIFVGPGADVLAALLRAGWYEVKRPTGLIAETNAPRLYGRVADAVFRLKRGGSLAGNELSFWLAPLRIDGQAVWLAQMTHYIDRTTTLGQRILDARLDPAVDDARNYLMQQVWYTQALKQLAWLAGERTDMPNDLSAYFGGARYFSDGFRVVLWLSAEPISLLDVKVLDWGAPPTRGGEEIAR